MHIDDFVAATEIVGSLAVALDKAGGRVGTGDLSVEIKKMSVVELLALLAPNHIRFVYAPPRKRIK